MNRSIVLLLLLGLFPSVSFSQEELKDLIGEWKVLEINGEPARSEGMVV
jgi:hypothetical protein